MADDETIHCENCGRECEPINDSDMPVTRCVDCQPARDGETLSDEQCENLRARVMDGESVAEEWEWTALLATVAALRAELADARAECARLTADLKASGKELAEVRESHRAFKLALLASLGVSDSWAITTWRQAEICGAIERLRLTEPRMTAEHDADIAYYEAHVKLTRDGSLNPAEYPDLDAEIVRIGEVRRLIQVLAARAASGKDAKHE